MTCAEKLLKLRLDKGLTQTDLAEVLQTSQQYYGKYEKGIRPLPAMHIVTLCRFYGISADWLLGIGEEE